MIRKLQRFALALFVAFGLAGAMAVPGGMVTATPAEAGILSGIKSVAKDIGGDFKDIGKGVAKGAEMMGKGVVKGAKAVGKATVTIGKAVKYGADKAGIIRTATSVGRTVYGAGKTVVNYARGRR
jgi:hypothetical protein